MTFSRKSLPMFWFKCAYIRDVPEDPEDLFNIVYFFDIIIYKIALLLFRVFSRYTGIHEGKPNHD